MIFVFLCLTYLQSLSSSSAHILLPPILLSMCFVSFSFSRWHRVGIQDKEAHQGWPCPWRARGVEEWELGWPWKWRGVSWFICTMSMVTPWTSRFLLSQWEILIKLWWLFFAYLSEGFYLRPHGTLKPQLPSHITHLHLIDSCSSSFWGEIQNSGY